MTDEKILARGAEAILIKKDNLLIKRRIKKSYRIPEIDERLRKLRTRAEGRIMKKLYGKINIPKIISDDEKNKEIIMEYIEGKKLSEHLDNFSLERQKKICEKIGNIVAILHENDIIHNDLTTSNMILKNNKIYFIDFGLSFFSKRIEDKAVDLHLFKQALESKHYKNFDSLWNSFLQGYKINKDFEKIMEQFKKVEKRGRYKH
ncbi:MAG: KEOPS complex kinase/ATPase Bud32 [Candidatus Pacearchaeota archaeon]